ncbi:SsrA-binding protein SmpB [Marinoscillum sp. MHG1-6]|uniref:SsrA-binding protein SmpB n=1 Tax=Marinoscillum sp. MHG1-6 TaxID=2959627 RepID=UPI00215822B3|nr:SsrA-binding protein SmpB [Marinoscillum sp. MHG1-6]
MQRFSNNIQIKNRKASYEFNFIEKFEAGLVLKGSEIKSIREGKASITEAYCFISKEEAFIKGMNISPYTKSSFNAHEPVRDRKLLLNKKEILKIKSRTEEKGLTLVPVRLYINARGLVKLEIALAQGKKLFDKRDSIKKKDQDRELKRMKLT